MGDSRSVALKADGRRVSFPDLLTQVPDLLPENLLHVWPTRGAAIRVLRLVSKEVCRIAQLAVQACAVDLRFWDNPVPQRVVRLIGDTRLRKLEITIHIVEGSHLSSVPQQRAKSVSRMECLITDLRTAIQSVTHLLLYVNYSRLPRSHHSGHADSVQASSSGGSPPLPARMFELLAEALPKLQHLSLGGDHHSRVTLRSYSMLAACRHMTGLSVESGTFDEGALQELHQAFPRITDLTFKNHDNDWVDDDSRESVYTFIESTELDLSSCINLSTLVIDSGESKDEILACWYDIWKHLPPNLTELRCNCPLRGLLPSENIFEFPMDLSHFLGRVRSLTLKEAVDSSLPLMLKEMPHLEAYTVTGEDSRMDLMWDLDISSEEMSNFKKRMLGGFQVSCPRVSVRAAAETIRDETAWIPPLFDTTCVAVVLSGTVHVDCLGQMVRLFPILVKLVLCDNTKWADEPLLGEAFLEPLTECKYLKKLEICFAIKHTHTGLVSLCTSMPVLSVLRCLPSKDVTYALVETALEAVGRNVRITEFDESELR